jgi:hypothetical protein
VNSPAVAYLHRGCAVIHLFGSHFLRIDLTYLDEKPDSRWRATVPPPAPSKLEEPWFQY